MKKLLAIIMLFATTFQLASAEAGKTDFAIQSASPNIYSVSTFIYELRPGDTVNEDLFLINRSETGNHVYVYGADSGKNRDGNTTYTLRNETNKVVGSWLTFENNQTKYDLEPKETKRIKFTVTVPPDTAYGDYEGGIMAENFSEKNDGGVNVTSRIGYIVKIKVTDNPQPIPKRPLPLTPTPFFWGTMAIFVASMAYFIWSGKKKHAKAKS